MAYVTGSLKATIDGDGNIVATLRDMAVHDGPRPNSGALFGADMKVLEAINARVPGTFESTVRPGVGVAPILEREGILSLDWGENDVFKKLEGRYGQFNRALITLFKDDGAPGGVFWKADTPSGVLTHEDIIGGAFQELVEVAPYGQGWMRYILNGAFAEYQTIIDRQQEFEWARLRRTMPRFSAIEQAGEVSLAPYPTSDILNGCPCLLRTEPKNGTLEELLVGIAGPMPAFQDTEHWVPGQVDVSNASEEPLDRAFVLILEREGKPPVAVMFHGGKVMGAMPVTLTGDNVQNLTTEKTKGVLQYLKWI